MLQINRNNNNSNNNHNLIRNEAQIIVNKI